LNVNAWLAQYVLSDTLAALGSRRLLFHAKLSKFVQEEVEAAHTETLPMNTNL